jgi:hypothetical protein
MQQKQPQHPQGHPDPVHRLPGQAGQDERSGAECPSGPRDRRGTLGPFLRAVARPLRVPRSRVVAARTPRWFLLFTDVPRWFLLFPEGSKGGRQPLAPATIPIRLARPQRAPDPGDTKSERWAELSRNSGRLHAETPIAALTPLPPLAVRPPWVSEVRGSFFTSWSWSPVCAVPLSCR